MGSLPFVAFDSAKREIFQDGAPAVLTRNNVVNLKPLRIKRLKLIALSNRSCRLLPKQSTSADCPLSGFQVPFYPFDPATIWTKRFVFAGVFFKEIQMADAKLNQFPLGVKSLFACMIALLLINRTASAEEPKHEKIDHAKQALTDAYDDLDKASDNFDGHKKEAMEKIKEAKDSLEKWHDHVGEAKEKMNKAVEELKICKEKGHDHHPKIEQAIDAVEAAKDELK